MKISSAFGSSPNDAVAVVGETERSVPLFARGSYVPLLALRSLLTGFFNGPSEKLKGALDAGGAAQYHVPWCPREQTKGIFVVAPHPGAGFTARPTKRSDHATVPRLRERSFRAIRALPM